MAIRLKSTLKKIPWRLPLRCFALALLLVYAPFWLFLLAAIYFYLKSGPQANQFWSLFLVLIFVLWAGSGRFMWFGFSFYDMSLAVFAFFAFFAIFGIKEFFFVHRREAYLFLNALLFLGVALMFFHESRPFQFYFNSAIFLLSSFLLFFDFYSFFNDVAARKMFLLTLVGTLVIFEEAFALSFLPIGFLSSSAVIVLSSFFLNYTYLEFGKKIAANPPSGGSSVMKTAAFFGASVFIIFLLSRWSI